ncbi:MAG: hypothetical protein E7486_03410 [Ruminococcaceae bacterium]|nr:hypothetical protein [Oscillospiraceae bacterium]
MSGYVNTRLIRNLLLILSALLLIGTFLIRQLTPLSGETLLFRVIFPVNNSPWEALKAFLFPGTALLLPLCAIGRRSGAPAKALLWGGVCALLAGGLTDLSLGFLYVGIFGAESVGADHLAILAAVFIWFRVGIRSVLHTEHKAPSGIFSFWILLLLGMLSFFFALSPPRIPLFRDPMTGMYGTQTPSYLENSAGFVELTGGRLLLSNIPIKAMRGNTPRIALISI